MKRRNPGATWRPFYHLLVLAHTGDTDVYAAERREALQQLAKNERAGQLLLELTARAALLRPVEVDDLKLAGGLLDRVLKDPDTARRRWRQLTKGLAEYRAGQFASAIDWLEKSRQGPPETPSEHLEAQALLVLAMAHHRLGQKDRARELLASAAKIIDERLPKGSTGAIGEAWPDWIITHALRREVADLVVSPARRAPLEAPPVKRATPKVPTP
jgi:tetratricopeptide (TPR) repeat protein